jgi:hypothetical protein
MQSRKPSNSDFCVSKEYLCFPIFHPVGFRTIFADAQLLTIGQNALRRPSDKIDDLLPPAPSPANHGMNESGPIAGRRTLARLACSCGADIAWSQRSEWRVVEGSWCVWCHLGDKAAGLKLRGSTSYCDWRNLAPVCGGSLHGTRRLVPLNFPASH